ncbi:MAG: UDP-N-acetylmuramoyl-tripeptide--D-alanyl-D-alanine ligase [Nitrospirae bacterium]|nr:UDP-N-acetylmuramoyl-tripeptide--D-alanyl-D-alanine ligase [Nitrospirota bacterium]
MYSVAQIADWCGGRVVGEGGVVIADAAQVVIDSRRVRPGDLFVALIGPNHDAHAFLPQAFAAGAAAAIVSDAAPARHGGAPMVQVADTEAALRDLARAWRARFRLPVAAITGSCGKTTTKEMARAILEPALTPLVTAGNLNNQIGLPLTLLGLRAGHRACVLEMGINRPGEIDLLCGVAAPTVGLVTGIGRAHLQGLGDADGVAAEKGRLFHHVAAAGGTCVVNLDDPRVVDQAARHGARRVVTYTTSPSARADLRLTVERATVDGARLTLNLGGDQSGFDFFSAAPYQVANAAAAAALCHVLGADVAAIRRGLSSFRPPAMRGAEITLASGARIIDDSYNANPESVLAALTALAATPVTGRRIAVLGDMLELGAAAPALHRQVGQRAAALGLDRLICVGALAAHMADGARAAGLDPRHVVTPELALAGLADLADGDRVLVKGSRGIAMERLVKALAEQGGVRA